MKTIISIIITAIISGLLTIMGHTDTFTVSNTNDSGAGSLRQAITNANNNVGADTINFSISGTIYLLSELPDLIDNDGLFINGTTAPDDSSGSDIIIDGINILTSYATGLDLGSDNNLIKGLFITNFISGDANGIQLGGHNNVVGGSGPREANVISGNYIGILCYGTNANNQIIGNFIGTDPSGALALPNIVGIASSTAGSSYYTVEANVISGNTDPGIRLDEVNEYKITGNKIGTDVTGNVAIPNRTGMVISDANGPCYNVIIGGIAKSDGNVISANTDYGIVLQGSETTNIKIIGNFIGTNISGEASLGNGMDGIFLERSAGNIIGGTDAGERNIISGNKGSGVCIEAPGADFNQVIGNYIGTDVSGSVDLGNKNLGVIIGWDAKNNVIGGSVIGAENIIAFNGSDGVRVDGENTTGNKITRNSIFNNIGLGINLNNGGNGDIAAPVITALGSVEGTALPGSIVEIFRDETEEGQDFLDSVAADPVTGEFMSTVDLSGLQGNITATATDEAGNTSEFSAPITIPNLFSITGNIYYYLNSDPVDDAMVPLLETSFSDTTNGDGNYELLELPSDNYVVRPEKENDISGAISAYDAAWILQYGVGLRTFTPYQMLAGDVSGNGNVTAYDAAKILQFGVGLINQFPVMEDNSHFWRFVPEDFAINDINWVDAPDSMAYVPLNRDTTDNYLGLIYGDVSGNWHPSESGLAKITTATADIRLENIYGKAGDNITLPLYVDNGSGIMAMSFTLTYHPQVLKAVGTSLTPLTRDYLIAHHIAEGEIKVVLAGGRAIEGSGSLVKLEFEVLGTTPDDAVSYLNITDLLLNEGSISANIQPGEFKIRSLLPEEYALQQNYPNPFNPETMIRYQLPEPGHVVLTIYNSLGQEVRTLIDEDREAGYHEIPWDGRDNQGLMVSSGVYFYRLQAGQFTSLKKMLFLR